MPPSSFHFADLPLLLNAITPCGLLPEFTTPLRQRQYWFEKRTAWDHAFHVKEIEGGNPSFIVDSLLDFKGKRREKKVEIKTAGAGHHNSAILVISRQASCWEWEIATTSTELSEQQKSKRGTSCRVKKVHSFHRAKFIVTFVNAIGEEEDESEETTWYLTGDKSKQSAIVTNQKGLEIAYLERHSRNKGQIFKNPHAYVMTAAPGVDASLLVALCVCLDQYENRSSERRHRREARREESTTRFGGMSGSFDTGSFGSACF